MSNRITMERGKTICLIGRGEACCRYVTGDIATGFVECSKHTSIAAELDRRVADGRMVARGNNCEGLRPELLQRLH